MLISKVALYLLTFAGALYSAYWEERIKRELTDGAVEQRVNVSDIGFLNDLLNEIRRERYLYRLPPDTLRKYRRVVQLKFLFAGVLILEVIFLHK